MENADPPPTSNCPVQPAALHNDSDDREVLNELIEYENVGMLRLEKAINSFDGDDLAFQCMIRFRKSVAYFDPFLSMNIITRKAYNTIMVEGLECTGKSLVSVVRDVSLLAVVRDVYVFVGSFTYITDFVVLEDIGEFIQIDKAEVVMAEGDLRKFSNIGEWVQVPRFLAWLDYDEHVDSLSMMDNEVGVASPESTTQTLPSFEEYTPPMTCPEEVEKTLGTPIEVEPLNKTKLEKVGLNCNHNTPFSSREVPSFDGPEP
nr:hypothetical protein [Tanacetum cinerariifolium]